MRILFASLLLAACATAAETTPATRLAGCWAVRPPAHETMRWSADPEHAGVLQGLHQWSAGEARYSLEQQGDRWRFCRVGGACWDVAEGQRGSLSGGRAFIDVTGADLRISVVDAGGQAQSIFHGRRHGCS